MLGYISRGLTYTAFFAGSVMTLSAPQDLLLSVVSGSSQIAALTSSFAIGVVVTWGIMFMFASVVCLLGVITRTWVGEYIGVGGVVFCIGVLALMEIIYGFPFRGIILIGVCAMMGYRWYTVAIERDRSMKRSQLLEDWRSRTSQE